MRQQVGFHFWENVCITSLFSASIPGKINVQPITDTDRPPSVGGDSPAVAHHQARNRVLYATIIALARSLHDWRNQHHYAAMKPICGASVWKGRIDAALKGALQFWVENT